MQKLFSDSMQDAQGEGRSKQQLCHGKNQIYIEIAKMIFLHDETAEFQSLAQMNPGVFASSIHSHLDTLKSKYQKQNTLLGQTGAGCIYEELMSGKRTRNTISMSIKEFPWWADLHGWWHTNPTYNNTWSFADSRKNFSIHAVELFKLWQTPPL
ncbi:hypothetical protein EDD17DRAFT_1472780 [Pisolithus thermaeus]|nr:hypothetical protein EDD17DRAFT_1472780 [Pisolithus thermaeus]